MLEEIEEEERFAIISSHPDAGKDYAYREIVLTGGAIHVAGAVKSNIKSKKRHTSRR